MRKNANRRIAFAAAICILVSGFGFSSAFAQPPDRGPSAVLADLAWFDYSRPAEYSADVARVSVPMRDGFDLGCVLARPAAGGEPAPGRFPGIFYSYTPYGSAVGAAQGSTARYLVERGYNVLSCDIRGTGISPAPGYDFDLDWPIEALDGYDAVEWLATQEFSTGKTAIAGTSYGGDTTMEVAAQQPPSLVAIAPNVPPMSVYHEIFYPGGARAGNDWFWVGAPAVANPTWDQRQLERFLAHPTYDSYWQSISTADTHDHITVPALITGGWFDVFRAGAVGHYVGLRAADHDQVWLVMGPWTHAEPWQQSREPMPIGAALAWFDHWLYDEESAPLPGSPITSYEVAGETGRWVELDAWPAEPGGDLLSFGSDALLDRRPAKPGVRDLVINPSDGPATTCLVGCLRPTDPRADNAVPDESRLTFTSPPLAEPAVLAGQAQVTLHAALPSSDGNLVAKVMDVSPDGRVLEVAAGWLRASHRFGHEQSVPVEPGVTSEFVIELQPTHWQFRTGHQVRVSLTTGDLPRLAPDDSQGVIHVATGARGSSVQLPFVERIRTTKAVGRP